MLTSCCKREKKLISFLYLSPMTESGMPKVNPMMVIIHVRT